MKKRIIGLILVVVMLTLSLVSCGYSLRDDDLAKYTTFEKANLDKALAELVIANADFGTDEEGRQKKVLDSIYASLADLVKNGEHKSEGAIGAHDVVFYNYYATVEDKVIYASTMKPGAENSLQLGLSSNEGVKALIAAELAKLTDVKEYIYLTNSTSTSSTIAEGANVYISYVVEYTEKDASGADKLVKTTVTYENVKVGDENHPVAAKLVGAKIGTAIEDFEVEVDGVKKSYSSAKINWVVDGGKAIVFTDKTYTKSTVVKDIYGGDVELLDKEIKYHVYPVYYISVDEFNATTVMNSLLSKFTKTTTNEDGSTKEEGILPSFTANLELVKAFAELKTAVETAKKAYDTAVTEESTAKKELDKAKDAVKEGETPTEAQQDTINKAQEAYDAKVAATATAKKSHEDAITERDAKLAEVLEKITEATIVDEYKKSIYDSLLADYNADVKEALAKAVWEAIKANVTVNTAPDKAVDEIYERMIESYESTFYDGTYDTTTKESNYKHYNASFSAFLVAKTGTASYKEAKQHVRNEAIEYVKPMVMVYFVAEVYGQKLTDDEVKAYKNDLSGYYSYYEAYYGETNTLTAYQFDKLMDHFLASEEKDGVVTYKNVKFTFKTEE